MLWSRLIRTVSLLPVLALALACGKIGNGDFYTGGGGTSTTAQVSEALSDVLPRLGVLLGDLARGNRWDELYAPMGCSETEPLCLVSSVESDGRRKFARDQIVMHVAGLSRELKAVKFELVEKLPDIENAGGHKREALGATLPQEGADVFIDLAKLRGFEPIALRPKLVEVVIHELLHHVTRRRDQDAYGDNAEPDGVERGFNFMAKVFRVLLYPRSFGSHPSDEPNEKKKGVEHVSLAVPMTGIPGGKVRGSPASVVVEGRVHAFAVSEQDNMVYRATYNGPAWSSFSPVHSSALASNGVSAAEYVYDGKPGIVVATSHGGWIYLFWSKDRTQYEALGRIPNMNTSESGPTNIYTSIAPKVLFFRNKVRVWVVGNDGGVYVSENLISETQMPQNYRRVFGESYTTSDRFEVSTREDFAAAYFVNSAGNLMQGTTAATGGWNTPGSLELQLSKAPSAAVLGNIHWLAYVDDATGKVRARGWEAASGSVTNAPEVDMIPTSRSPSLVAFSGRLIVFTVDSRGLLFQTQLR